VLTTRAGPWFEVLPFFVAPHTRPPRDAVMPNAALHAEFFVPLSARPHAPLVEPATGLPDVSNAVAALEAITPVAASWRGWGELGRAWSGTTDPSLDDATGGPAAWPKWPSWRGDSWPPRAPQTAAEGSRLLY